MEYLYICHTYYQVYIAIISALNDTDNRYTLCISECSTKFFDLKEKICRENIFKEVLQLNEKHPTLLAPNTFYKRSEGNAVNRILTRIKYTKEIIKNIEKDVNIDFSKYDEIFLCNDSDPIGFYFWKHKIKYTLVEDSFNLYQRETRYGDLRGDFLKRFLFKLGLIYIPNGYAKNAIKIEVNENKNLIDVPLKKVYELSREKLLNGLSQEQKQSLIRIFRGDNIINDDKSKQKKKMLLITQCLYPIDVPTLERECEIYRRIVDEYIDDYQIYLKPHPRDLLNYEEYFKECIILKQYYPIEILNLINDFEFDLVLTIFSTAIDTVTIAKEKKILGKDYIYK